MSKMNTTELDILNQAVAQLTYSIRVSQQQQNKHLLSSQVSLLDSTPPAGTPDPTSLNDILNNVVQVPGSTSIATVPNNPEPNMYQTLAQIQTLDSYVALLTAYCLYNEHPAPYDITDPLQACAFARATAKWRNYVITGGAVKAIAGYIPVGSITAQSYEKNVTSAELHLEFLTELFGGFGLPTAAMTQLDSILTKVVAKLGDAKFSFETQSDTLDHFLSYYYFETVTGTGGTGQPPAMYVAKMATLYLHVAQSSWKAAVGKSSVDKFSFAMSYYDMTTSMNSGLVANDMNAINGTIQTLTSKTATEVNKLMNMQAIHADPKPA